MHSIISTELFGTDAALARQIDENEAPPYENDDLVSVISAELFTETAAPSRASASVEASIIDDDGLSVVSTSLFPEADSAAIVLLNAWVGDEFCVADLSELRLLSDSHLEHTSFEDTHSSNNLYPYYPGA